MEKTSATRTDLSKYDNSWYKPGGLVKRLAWYLVGRLTVNTYLPFPVSVKVLVLRVFGAKIGKSVMIKPKVNIKYPWFLTIGENAWIGENVWIDNLTYVTIGANSCLSQGALLLTGNHNYKTSTFDLRVDPIVLEDGVWIGAKAVVCPGVHCGSHAMLTVNSVATKNLSAYGIYSGNPAQFSRKRKTGREN
ncbi:WcaF family extracellular polysaccharide biosynthesis acetyltransferase [Arundinibacter roseus]|uniref:Colanic acid biosynthesis acetyltransferase WcaF n=1 Tax=Arundinibacter roseus TaxID=2070510 RepID=A0A4R4K9K5_9BACT|nr:WcaF family extracellular polysaccharide biosynthesis acetyltransferase [Arundinibacter roseus]TDB64497.1 colanic acid biosynthesis acetyltransferase WcaF [Arundinibacter roseus]